MSITLSSIRIAVRIRMGAGERQQGQVEQDKPLSDHIEALCGAAFLAGGWDGAAAFVHRLLEGDWPSELPTAGGAVGGDESALDPMSELTQLVNQLWKRSLDKEHDWDVWASGPDHAREHTAAVTLPNGLRFEGKRVPGKAKAARASAAASALGYLRDLAASGDGVGGPTLLDGPADVS